MNSLSLDQRLFLLLNFDGGPVLDWIMSTVSGVVMWIPLYLFIAWAVNRRFGWKSLIAFLVCLALAMGLSDMLCGIFKHSGLLKDLWADFPARHRPMFDQAVRAHRCWIIMLIPWDPVLTVRKRRIPIAPGSAVTENFFMWWISEWIVFSHILTRQSREYPRRRLSQ